MSSARPVAASGTRTTAVPSTAGRIGPNAASTPSAPMSLMRPGAKSVLFKTQAPDRA
jgi:hypothetical protein